MRKKGIAFWIIFVAAIPILAVIAILLFSLVITPEAQRQEDTKIVYSGREVQIVLDNLMRTPYYSQFDNLPETTISTADLIRKMVDEPDGADDLADLLAIHVKRYFLAYEKDWLFQVWVQTPNGKWLDTSNTVSNLVGRKRESELLCANLESNNPFYRGVYYDEGNFLRSECHTVTAFQIIPNYPDAPYPLIATVLIINQKERSVS